MVSLAFSDWFTCSFVHVSVTVVCVCVGGGGGGEGGGGTCVHAKTVGTIFTLKKIKYIDRYMSL